MTKVGPAHGSALYPDVQGVSGHTEVRLRELIVLGPAQGGVAQSLLYNDMEPGKQEVHTCPLIGWLHHPAGWHRGEGPHKVGLHAWWRARR